MVPLFFKHVLEHVHVCSMEHTIRNVSLNNSTFPQIIYLINILEIDIHMSTSSDPGNSHNNVKKVL